MDTKTPPAVPCCPKTDPARWEDKTHVWQSKLFIQDSVMQFFHIPLNMPQVVARMWRKVEAAGAAPEPAEFLMLAYDPSPWKCEIYMNITREVPGAHMARLSGTFLSRVFDGPYNAVPEWIGEMDAWVKAKGKTTQKYYFYFTTCPKCAKLYGHNYVVAFAQVE